jgi:hypothetical protein
MTAPLSAQSAIEILESEWHTGDSVQALIVLRRVVKDYSSLRAEVELLRKDNNYFHAGFDSVREDYEEQKARAEKAEAQLAKVCERNRLMDDNFGSLLEKNINLEEQLAKQAPLVNALLRIANEAFPLEVTEKCMRSVARAALKLWEGEGK